MSQTPLLPNYDDIKDALSDTRFTPAEVHGLFCGYITATSGKVTHQWEKIILGKHKNPDALALLQSLYEITYHQLSEFSFEFSLVLPSDAIDINLRTEALGLWCQGFLSGLTQYNIPLQNREESDVTEILNNLIEIAQVNFGDIADDDEDETAYFELVEYVRLGALMVFQDLKAANPNTATDENDVMH